MIFVPMWLKRWVYKRGYRPKRGNPFYSPSYEQVSAWWGKPKRREDDWLLPIKIYVGGWAIIITCIFIYDFFASNFKGLL